MKSGDANPQISEYLRRLRWALQLLPESDREDLVLEVADHLTERAKQPEGLTAALKALGSPQDFAGRFIEEFELHTQLNQTAPRLLLFAMLSRAPRSISAALVGLAGALLYSLAVAAALVAIGKLVAPGFVGWWWANENAFAIGIASPPPAQIPELLGYWIMPIFVLISVLTYSLGFALVRAGARRLLELEATHGSFAMPTESEGDL